MSNTLTVRAMKLRMVLKFMRPMLQEPSTSSMMSAFALVLHWASAETLEEQSADARLEEYKQTPDNSRICVQQVCGEEDRRGEEKRRNTAALQDGHTAQEKSSAGSAALSPSPSGPLLVLTPPSSGVLHVHG